MPLIQSTRTVTGPTFNEGARQLWTQQRKRRLSLTKLAKLVGVTHSEMSHVIWGDKRPSLKLALEIEREFGIACRAWVLAPKRPFEPPTQRAA